MLKLNDELSWIDFEPIHGYGLTARGALAPGLSHTES